MRRSTQDAHYTSPTVVCALWAALEHFGFSGGRFLEPAFGIGHFWGLMPLHLRERSHAIPVELDPISARIAQHLYPSLRVHAIGFQHFATEDGSLDGAVGNVPFGSQHIFDTSRPSLAGLAIHNYFIARSLLALRPGGLLATVVSTYFLDAKNGRMRKLVNEYADFLGAIRVPNTSFLANAGTDVTTDLIFLQRRHANSPKDRHNWLELAELPDPDGGPAIPINAYFATHPEMLLGHLQRAQGEGGRTRITLNPTGDLKEQLALTVRRLPDRIYVPPPPKQTLPDPSATPSADVLHLAQQTKVYGYFIEPHSRTVMRRLPDSNGDLQVAAIHRRTFGAADHDRQRMALMIELCDQLVAQLTMERTGSHSPDTIETHRADLLRRYERFRGYFGYLHDPGNKSLMRADPQWPLLLALESRYDRGVSKDLAAEQNIRSRPRTAKLGEILRRRVRFPHEEPTHAASANDGLLISLSHRGKLDLDYIQTLTGLTRHDVLRTLSEAIFELPDGEWQTRDQYLSGAVKDKLRDAEQLLAAGRTEFARNVAALKTVQPADLVATDIYVRLGAPWLPPKVVQTFAAHLFGDTTRSAFQYLPAAGRWASSLHPGDEIANRQTWGTPRRTGAQLFEAILNNHPIRIYDLVRDANQKERQVLDDDATHAAQEMAERIKTEFSTWIWQDIARRTELCRLYNDTFNTRIERTYDGSHLGRNPDGTRRTLPGANPLIEFRPHQLNAIWRGIQERTGLLDHVVGAGKTFVVIAVIMELRRLGLIRRPMLVVPNHLVGEWATDFHRLYPGANILVPSKDDFTRERRQQLLGRIASADWDAVIVAHSSFGFIDMPMEEFDLFIRNQIEQLEEAARLADAIERADGKRGRTVKQLEKLKDSLQERLRAKLAARQRDKVIDFSELGVDAIGLDEAQEFKNLMFATALRNVAGLGTTSGSNKAMDLFVKVRYIQRHHDGKNVFFATGTPISNSIAEMYTVMRYLAYDRLAELGLLHFDAWQSTFASLVTDWEIDSTAVGYRLKERLARFNNLPELMNIYRAFADVITREDIDATRIAAGLPPLTPPVHGGAPENVIAERSETQAAYMDRIVERALALKDDPDGRDNMLVITTDARKAALDIRLVDPSAPDFAGSKVNIAVGRIFELWEKWKPLRGTQLVFCDLSTPRGARSKEAAFVKDLQTRAAAGDEEAAEQLERYTHEELQSYADDAFDVYNDLRQKLIARGIPAEEIAFIHDAHTDLQRQELFEAMRQGRIRILIGSSRKMGAGMNVQTRLVGLHHLDTPWKPMEVEQREGRIIRQGNLFYEGSTELAIAAIADFKIHILRYATRLTYDARMWQCIEIKARFLTQLRRGCSERAAFDIAAQAANAADMKAAASGNPLIIQEVQLRAALQRLEALRRAHQATRHRWQDTIRHCKGWKERAEQRIAVLQRDIATCTIPGDAEFVGMTVNSTAYDNRRSAGFALIAEIRQMQKSRRLQAFNIALYRGFTVSIQLAAESLSPTLTIHAHSGSHSISYRPEETPDPVGITVRLDHSLHTFAEQIAQVRETMATEEHDLAVALQHVDRSFDKEEEYWGTQTQYAQILAQIKSQESRQWAA
jgi:N12 class adenine-specific DNA methylase